jgi:hypothetical protein
MNINKPSTQSGKTEKQLLSVNAAMPHGEEVLTDVKSHSSKQTALYTYR